MLDYAVDPAVLRDRVPAGVALDLFEGRALVTVVGFRFLRTRVLGLAVPGHRDFDEVNLRFYVRRETPSGEVRRGVTFVRELVPRIAIALVARGVFNEPYRALPMRSDAPDAPTDAPGRLTYAWRTHARWQHVAATAVGPRATPPSGSEAEFVTRRHWGYTRQRDGGTIEYAVHHPPWRVWIAGAPELDADIADLWGAAFVPFLSAPPVAALVADGSAVTVSSPSRIVDYR
jgi:uncharacterized protein YqjF (DUF2071 family)